MHTTGPWKSVQTLGHDPQIPDELRGEAIERVEQINRAMVEAGLPEIGVHEYRLHAIDLNPADAGEEDAVSDANTDLALALARFQAAVKILNQDRPA